MRIELIDGRAVLVDDDGRHVGTLTLDTVPTSALVAAATAPDVMHWEGVICLEETPSGDGRMMAAGALTWTVPFPLTWRPDDGNHEGRTIGTVWTVERRGNEIWGAGTFDVASPATPEFPEGVGLEAARQIDSGLIDGVSVELDSYEVELRADADVIDEMEASMAAVVVNEVATEGDEVDGDGRVLLDRFAHDDFLEVTVAGRVRTLALVTTPAHDQATIALASGVTLAGLRAGQFPQTADDIALLEDVDPTEGAPSSAVDPDGQAVAAAAGAPPLRPPAEWFDDPGFGTPDQDDRLVPWDWDDTGAPTAWACPLTVTADGRLFGHVAPWGACHVGRSDTCLTAPQSLTDYAFFRIGETEVDCTTCPDADPVVATGVVTTRTVHPNLSMVASDANAHYADTGAAAADVAAGEDDYGIWVAGALRPGVTDVQRRELRGSGLSGDWRRVGAGLEMIAALAVNSPGFPIPRRRGALAASAGGARPRARVRHGRVDALVGLGMPGADWFSVRDVEHVPVDALADRRLARMERVLAPQIAEQLRVEVHGSR